MFNLCLLCTQFKFMVQYFQVQSPQDCCCEEYIEIFKNIICKLECECMRGGFGIKMN